MSTRFTIGSFISAFWIVGCSASGPQQSAIKHLESDIPRSRSEAEWGEDSGGPDNCKLAEEYCDYMSGLFKTLVSSNLDVFQGSNDIIHYNVGTSNLDWENAYADPESGNIVFFKGIYRDTDVDAHVVSVMAHEASHILMRHDLFYFDDHPFLLGNSVWMAEKTKVAVADLTREDRLAALQEKLDKLVSQRDSVVQKIADFISPIIAKLPKQLRERILANNQIRTEAHAAIRELRESAKIFPQGPERAALLGKLEYYQRRATQAAEDNAFAETKLIEADSALNAAVMKALDQYLGGFLGGLWKKLQSDIVSANEEIKSVNAEGQAAHDDLERLGSQLLGFDYRPENWAEAEADQVGLELYLKAGFKASEFSHVYLQFIAEPDTRKACQDSLDRALAGEDVPMPERGRESHPFDCWRAFNTRLTEIKLHKSRFDPLLSNATKTEVFPGKLQAIKDELPSAPAF